MSQPAQPPKSPGVAAVLGFLFPGIGQMYNGQFGRGIAFIGVDPVNGLLTLIWVGFVTGFLFAVFSAWDAYRSAEAYNRKLAAPAEPAQNDAVPDS